MIGLLTACMISVGTHINKINLIPSYVMMEEYNDMYILSHDGRISHISDEEKELIARCVMSEAGGASELEQEAVATVIFNRYFSPNYPNTFKEILAPGQFSLHDNGEITTEVYLSVSRAMVNYGTGMQCLPYNCYYFRASHYHNFGIPYMQIGNTYFSLSEEATD